MANKRKKTDFAPQLPPDKANPCQVAGCPEPGIYKAPRDKDRLHDYQWYCLEHVREHNKQWDYFEGMDAEGIEHFIKDAVTGHRPTWERESRLHKPYERLQDALHAFLHDGAKRPRKPQAPLTPKLRRALAVFSMEHPYTARELKARYRTLIKQYHPDLHKGDAQAQEKFKIITVSYHELSEYLKKKP